MPSINHGGAKPVSDKELPEKLRASFRAKSERMELLKKQHWIHVKPLRKEVKQLLKTIIQEQKGLAENQANGIIHGNNSALRKVVSGGNVGGNVETSAGNVNRENVDDVYEDVYFGKQEGKAVGRKWKRPGNGEKIKISRDKSATSGRDTDEDEQKDESDKASKKSDDQKDAESTIFSDSDSDLSDSDFSTSSDPSDGAPQSTAQSTTTPRPESLQSPSSKSMSSRSSDSECSSSDIFSSSSDENEHVKNSTSTNFWKVDGNDTTGMLSANPNRSWNPNKWGLQRRRQNNVVNNETNENSNASSAKQGRDSVIVDATETNTEKPSSPQIPVNRDLLPSFYASTVAESGLPGVTAYLAKQLDLFQDDSGCEKEGKEKKGEKDKDSGETGKEEASPNVDEKSTGQEDKTKAEKAKAEKTESKSKSKSSKTLSLPLTANVKKAALLNACSKTKLRGIGNRLEQEISYLQGCLAKLEKRPRKGAGSGSAGGTGSGGGAQPSGGR